MTDSREGGNTKISTLVIGGAGYIGASLVPMLLAYGRQVTVIGRKPAPSFVLPDGVKYVQGDFSQVELIRVLLEQHREVVHLAYATVPNTSFVNPLDDLLQNLPPAVQLFQEMAKRKCRLVLVSSGGTVYGEAYELPIKETHRTNPISPYGLTKLTLENYAYLYAATHGLEYVCVRPSNAYGPGQRPFSGQGFIATAMASALLGRPIQIFGEKGTIRDYLYVSDMAAGIVHTLIYGRASEIYNLSSGVGLSNRDVIEAMAPLMWEIGCKIEVECLPERAFDVKANVLDSAKLQAHTGWKARVGLNDGLRLTRDWLRKN